MMKGVDDCEEFSVVDQVVHLGRGQGLGIVPEGTQFFGHSRVPLPKDCS